MAMRICKTALVGVVFAGLLSNPPDLSSCGPFVPTAAFTFWKMPEDAAGRFARGELGIVQAVLDEQDPELLGHVERRFRLSPRVPREEAR